MGDDASKLIDDLRTLPGIVGSMGKSIANSQHLLNLDYLRTMQVFLRAVRSLPKETQTPQYIHDLLRDISPPRYQFTETRIEFRADLFESEELKVAGSIGAGFNMGMGAVAISVSGSYGSRRDYRAAARIATTLHAIPSSDNTLTELLKRAASLDVLPLPTPQPNQPTGPEAQLGDHLKTVAELLGLDPGSRTGTDTDTTSGTRTGTVTGTRTGTGTATAGTATGGRTGTATGTGTGTGTATGGQ